MKRQFAVILLLISILSLSGCHKEPSTPKALVPSIMYNGEIYCSTGKQMPGEVAEDAIIGEITSTVPLSQWPEEDGRAVRVFPAAVGRAEHRGLAAAACRCAHGGVKDGAEEQL